MTWLRVLGLLIVVSCGISLILGSAARKTWSATGGSRSDGTINLSYEVSPFETAQVSESQGLELATQRCRAWGYSGAEAFGGITTTCNRPGGMGGCSGWLVSKQYQCLGDLKQ